MSNDELGQELTVVTGTSCTGGLIVDAIASILRKDVKDETSSEPIKTKIKDEDVDNDPNFKPEVVPDPVYDDATILEDEKPEEVIPIDFKEAFKELQNDES